MGLGGQGTFLKEHREIREHGRRGQRGESTADRAVLTARIFGVSTWARSLLFEVILKIVQFLEILSITRFPSTINSFFFLNSLFYIGVQLINDVVFQVYSKVIQLYIYMYLLFFKFFSHLGCYIILSRVPCAIQEVLISYLF